MAIEPLKLNEAGGRDGSWFYVFEPEGGKYAPDTQQVRSGNGQILTKRPHGYGARVEVIDASGHDLSAATLLRAAAAAGRALEDEEGALSQRMRVVLGPRGTATTVQCGDDDTVELHLDGDAIASSPSHHPIEAAALGALSEGPRSPLAAPQALPEKPTSRVLFFEALMNTDVPHNHTELSQGVLHIVSPLQDLDVEVVLCDVKMPITGEERPVYGLENLTDALSKPVGLVCITLLEGYFEGACQLIAELRELGCRAHIAVGGVMPTLTPEHVAAHLPDVSFVCRGAGEPIVRRLVEILGDASIDVPLTADQRTALLHMDGVLSIERTENGLRLLAANPGHTNVVRDLDTVALDLDHIQPRHLENGVELCTSRGCIHKCTFCTIIGRQDYMSRSAENLFGLLGRYEARYREIYSGEIPQNAYKLHLSDDDFACDKPRAASFFEQIQQTPFRLASVQVAITDLCKREGGKLLAEPDHELLDTIRPECFFQPTNDVTESDLVHDHNDRRWSAYLAMGVESFQDRELTRLGKGYKRIHLRAIANELHRRGLHFDAYFILANSETSGGDLIEVLEEVARLKLRFPTTFHVKYPIVPRLVSVFPSASHRLLIRQGRAEETLEIRLLATVENHPEFDYPFVEHDIPRDPWARSVKGASLFSDERRYLESLSRLREQWGARIETQDEESLERKEGERLMRRLADRDRRLVFDYLLHSRDTEHSDPEWPGPRPDETQAIATAVELLGPTEEWKLAFKRFAEMREGGRVPRLVVIPTWQCELRCGYCYIPKQDGRVMSKRTLERAIDMLMASDRDEVILQYFGGEALLEYALVQHGIEYATEQAERYGKSVQFIVSSNGWSLDQERLSWLAQYPVKMELSLDGDEFTQTRYRTSARWIGGSSYENSIVNRAAWVHETDLPYDVIMVVHPRVVDRMPANFFHVADAGYRRIQINFALGFKWTDEQKAYFASGLKEIGLELRRRWAAGEQLDMVNLDGKPMHMRLNGEITVDWDGTVYGGNGFLHETEHKEKFKIGHLADLQSFDSYYLDMPTNDYLLEWSYPAETTENNLEVGAIFTSWVRWMQHEPCNPNPSFPPRVRVA